jgi:hypothetical protein
MRDRAIQKRDSRQRVRIFSITVLAPIVPAIGQPVTYQLSRGIYGSVYLVTAKLSGMAIRRFVAGRKQRRRRRKKVPAIVRRSEARAVSNT